MPKLSKRKRQLKEIHTRKGDEAEGPQEEDEEESVGSQSLEIPSSSQQQQQRSVQQQQQQQQQNSRASARQQSQKQVRAAAAAAVQSQASRSTNQTSHNNHQQGAGANAQQSSDKVESGDKVWVQCNLCEKWRSLPSTVDPKSLPEVWTCDLNIYDHERMRCEAPEEDYSKEEEQHDLPLKAFLKVWVKKLKNADRAETRLASSSVTRNKKRRMDTEWIQCSNPGCGKWRSLTSGIEAANLIKRLNKNKRFGGDSNWYCSMNSWDDTTASCAAPQEPLWNCRWNLARANNGANSSF